VTFLCHRLKVGCIPEQAGITLVRSDVVYRVSDDALALVVWALAVRVLLKLCLA